MKRVKLIAPILLCVLSQHAPWVHAEDATKKIYLFSEDPKKARDALDASKQAILSSDKAAKNDFDVQAPSIHFEEDSKTIVADGGMLISAKGVQAQAEKGRINTETKDANLEGNVVFTGLDTTVEASKAAVNVEDETGEFENATFTYENGGYEVSGRDVFKLSETRYKLFDSKFTTCHCLDGLCPWSIESEEATISQNGYAKSWNTVLWFHGVPIFYSPFFAFPAKLERTSGLLAPTFGYSSKDGFEFKQPIFISLDESTDLTVSPFTQVKTRNGSYFDYKQVFSKNNNAEGRLLYSNESPRGKDLRGTRTEDLVDPTIDTNRVGIYYNQIMRGDADAILPYQFIADVHHVGDGTMVKELGDGDIVDPTTRVATSTALLRSSLGEYFSGEILGEWNQAIIGKPIDQELIFDKAPEASLSFLKSFRPIENPYGLRLVSRANLTETVFTRELGYDGARTNFNPSATIPFHLQNYVSGSIGGGAYIKGYSLNDTAIPQTDGLQIEDGQTSSVPYLVGKLSTAFEKVYEVDSNSSLAYLTDMGAANQDNKLVRVKHVIEPLVGYTLVPDISQNDLPQFDQLDRIDEKSLVTYGFSTSLLGRFTPRKDVATGVPEFTPELRDFPAFDGLQPLPDFGDPQTLQPVSGDVSLRNGEIRELLTLSMTQGYDFRKEYRRQQQQDAGQDSNILPLTDIKTSIGTTPTQNFALKLDTYYNENETRFTGWGLTTKLTDDRGDGLYASHTFVGPTIGNRDGDVQIDQTEGGVEAVLSERLKLGVYSRYNDADGQEKGPITNRVALRVLSACNCWHMDIGYTDKTNPDKQLMYVNFTFTGLGDISQELFSWGQTGSR